MSISRIEQETIINFNEEEKTASVYTFNQALQRKLLQLAKDRPEEVKQLGAENRGSMEFEIPKRGVKVNASLILTDEQREFRREQGRNLQKR